MARGMQPEDIGALVSVGEPRVSPDGRTVAFTVTAVDLEANKYRRRIWLAAADGSSPPRPFTAGDCGDERPRWSPRGDELAFVSHRRSGSGEEGCELYVAPVGVGGEVRRVVAWPEDIEELAWSPDGTRLAFLARESGKIGNGRPVKSDRDRPPRRLTRLFFREDSIGWTADRVRQLLVVAADGSSPPVPVTAGEYQVGGLAWSPDGTRLAFASARHETWDLDLAVDLWVAGVPPAGGEPGPLLRLTTTGDVYGSPSWSPDGSRLAFISFGDPSSGPHHGQIGVLDLATGEMTVLTGALDRNCAPFHSAREPVWGPGAPAGPAGPGGPGRPGGAEELLFVVEDAGNGHLYAAGPSGVRLLVGGDREVSGFDAAGGTIAFCASLPTAAGELFALDADQRSERQLTRLGVPFAEARRLVAPIPFTARAEGGPPLTAWAMPPAAAEPGRRYPTLLNIHGGPFTQYGNRFFDEFQLQAGAGFAVIYANPRGSSGSTEAFGRAIRWPEATVYPGSGWGGVDYDDVMAVVDEAARFDFVDPDRLGVLGGSYGGYMASWIVGHTDRFVAACSERSCNDLLALEYNSDFAGAFWTEVGVSHLDDPEAYRRQSPITYVRDMTTPLLILHSDQDLRCPLGQAEELFVALRLLGRHPEMVVFPGESHELSRSGAPRHRVQRAEIILEWFRRHLGS